MSEVALYLRACPEVAILFASSSLNNTNIEYYGHGFHHQIIEFVCISLNEENECPLGFPEAVTGIQFVWLYLYILL